MALGALQAPSSGPPMAKALSSKFMVLKPSFTGDSPGFVFTKHQYQGLDSIGLGCGLDSVLFPVTGMGASPDVPSNSVVSWDTIVPPHHSLPAPLPPNTHTGPMLGRQNLSVCLSLFFHIHHLLPLAFWPVYSRCYKCITPRSNTLRAVFVVCCCCLCV